MNRIKRTISYWAMPAAVALGLAGCATKSSYIVLMDNGDGTTGKVLVTGSNGTTILDKPHEATVIGSPSGKVFTANDEMINKDFGIAMAAAPKKPVSFVLLFVNNDAVLTAKSEVDIPRIVEEIGSRSAPDISIIGHTDTVGDDDANYLLGLKRANFVANIFNQTKHKIAKISVESHGEKNLLVPTPDNTPEPRNRAVEIIVR